MTPGFGREVPPPTRDGWHPLRPSPLEIASGCVFGDLGAHLAPKAGAVHLGDTPAQAFELAVTTALQQPPCLVSFSGGRDSSAVLAAATRVARRLGLPLPVPATFRFPHARRTEESTWQRFLIGHLELPDWHIETVTDELDLVGPVAQSVLRRHGVLWPGNAFLHKPLMGRAAGGTLLTGMGGDQVLGGWSFWSLGDRRARRRGLLPLDPFRALLAAAPTGVRERAARVPRLNWWTPTWLRPQVRRDIARLQAVEAAAEPPRYAPWLRWQSRRRDLAAMRWSYQLIADEVGVDLVHPFLDSGFLSALAAAGGRDGFGERTQATAEVFGTLLPPQIVTRPDKAEFSGAFWTATARTFTGQWSGAGVDPELVDPVAVRAEWQRPTPDSRSALQLQAAWLAGAPDT